ncbi:SUSD2-like protein, partial [Mya arenaria]
ASPLYNFNSAIVNEINPGEGVFPGRIPSNEHIETPASKTDMAWYDSSPSSLTLTWHPEMLSNNSYDRGMYSFLTTLGTDIQASQGTYTINPQDHQCVGNLCQYEIGFLEDMSWLDNLLHCPCSLSQALSDFGRWQPDVGCNLNSRSPNNCFYHGTAVHCVRAVQPVNGAGNQCCYSSTGLLIYAADTFQGSTPDRGHDWGAAPYRTPGHVPSLSHWLEDVVTFYYCCLWTGYNSCDYYMDQRPTKDCAGYNPPIPDDQKINTTVTLTSVAVQDVGTSDRVEIQLCGPEYNRSQKRLNVRVNGDNVWFDSGPMFWQDFKGSVNDERSSLFETFLQANHSLLGPVVLSPTPLPNIGSGYFCEQDKECAFDYKMTGSRAIAQSTRDAAARFDGLYQNLQPVSSCGLLDVPRSKKSNYGYTVGTTTTITGCRVGELQGTSTYTCTATSNTTQQWTPTVEAVCSISVEDADIGLIVGVIVAVLVVLVIAIVVAVVAIKKRRSQKWKRSAEKHEPEESETMKTT